MRVARAYFWVCTILRGGVPTVRQGTISAMDELEAIDKVYALGKDVWDRLVTEVTIMGDGAGEVLATSKVGDRMLGGKNHPATPVQKAVKDQCATEEKPKKQQAGFVPWNANDNWYPTQFGSYFQTPTFGKVAMK